MKGVYVCKLNMWKSWSAFGLFHSAKLVFSDDEDDGRDKDDTRWVLLCYWYLQLCFLPGRSELFALVCVFMLNLSVNGLWTAGVLENDSGSIR